MPWHINKVAQRGKVYLQAVNRTAPNTDGKYTVGLGYLKPHGPWDDDTLARAIKGMDEAGDRIWRLPLHSTNDLDERFDPADEEKARKESIKEYAIDVGVEGKRMDAMLRPDPGDLTRLTFGTFVDLYFKKMRPKKVGALTWSGEVQRLPRLLEHFKDKPLKELSTLGWVQYLNGPLSVTIPRLKGRGAHKDAKPHDTSPRTKALFQALYKEVLKLAELLGAVRQIHKFPTIDGVTKGTLEVTPLTAKEVLAMLEHAPSPMYRCLIAVGAGAALRPGELLRVRWEDIKWEQEYINVRGTKTAKSGDPIPLIPFVLRELRAWHALEGKPATGLLFSYRGEPLQSYKSGLDKAAERAGLVDGVRRIHQNVLRHTCATLMATSNPPVPLATARAVMRHSDETMLMRVYTHAGVMVMRDGLSNYPLK